MTLDTGDKTAIIVGSAFALFFVVLIIFELAYRLCVHRKRTQLFPKPKPVKTEALPWFKAFKSDPFSSVDTNPAWGRPSYVAPGGVGTFNSYQDAAFTGRGSAGGKSARPSLGYIDVRRESLGGPGMRSTMGYIDVRRDSYLDANEILSPTSPQYMSAAFLQSPAPSYLGLSSPHAPSYIEPVSPRSPGGVSYMEAVSSLRSPSAVSYMEAVGSPPRPSQQFLQPPRASQPTARPSASGPLRQSVPHSGYLQTSAAPSQPSRATAPVHPSLAKPLSAAALDEVMFQNDDKTFSAEAQARTWSMLNDGISGMLSGNGNRT